MDLQSTSNDIKPNITSINGTKDGPPIVPTGQLARQSALNNSNNNTAMAHGAIGVVPSTNGGENVTKEALVDDERVDDWPSLEDLEKELPQVIDGQVFLGFLMHQLVQDLYAQLLNIAETLGRASDTVKKAKLQQWLSLAYKQVSKVYVLAKWSRNAEDIQKAMNIAAFLRTQGEQIMWATKALHSVQDEFHRMRVRNPDLLTALDVLTTGNYTRLASIHQETFVKKKPLTNKEISGVFNQVEDVMRMRLLCKDIVPVEMGRWRIQGGRTFFTVPRRFETSLIMTGAQKDDIWAFVHVEFLFGVPEGERKGSKEFPRRPPKAFSDDLAFQIRDIIMTPTSIPDVPFASAVVDAPLIRVYNFLLLLSLSYQLEILIFQATQLLLHGWKDHLKLSVAINRKSFTVQYWVRQPASSGFPAGIPQPPSLPWFGGEVTISIVPAIDPRKSTVASAPRPFDLTSGIGSSTRVPNTPINPQQVSVERDFRSPADRIKAQMERRLKLRGATAVSDEVDHCKFEVQWKPQPNALGQVLVPSALDHSGLEIDSDCLDFEALLTKVLRRHADAIMEKHLENAKTLATSEGAILFPHPDEIMLTRQGEGKAIRVQLSGNQFIVISMDAESGRYIVNESGDLGGATRGVRWKGCQKHINQNPISFLELCWRVRHAATIENIETRANLLGIHTFRQRNLRAPTLLKFGPHTGVVYLQLADFPQHYVAIINSHTGLKFALIELQEHFEYNIGTGEYYINDFGWVQAEKFFQLDSERRREIQDDEMEDVDMASGEQVEGELLSGQKRKRPQVDVGLRLPLDHTPITRDPLDLSIQQIRDLHAYCRARVAHTLIESQLKARNIPYIHVRPPLAVPRLPLPKPGEGPKVSAAHQRALETLRHRQAISKSPLESYLPILSVRSSDLLAGAAAAEAAMPNIRIEPIEWWSLDRDCMVNTSVQLKYVQPLDQPRSSDGGANGKIICPSENISYDTRTSVITFLSRKVGDCVDEFLKEWARVSKVVVIARQISLMPDKKGWKDVRILSFDLQTVEFAYCRDYSLSITSVDGIYRLSFSRCAPPPSNDESNKMVVDTAESSLNPSDPRRNAHEDCTKYAQELLKDDRLGASVFELVGFLRSTVNVVEMLDILEEEESTRSLSTNQSPRFDILVKATGWWRIRYLPSPLFAASDEMKSYALDARLIKGRIMLVDGSVDLRTGKIFNHSSTSALVAASAPTAPAPTPASASTTTATTTTTTATAASGSAANNNNGNGAGATTAPTASSGTGAAVSSQQNLPVALLPIDRMEEHVRSVLEEVGKESELMADGVYPVNYGSAIICGRAGAPKLMKLLHEKILGGL